MNVRKLLKGIKRNAKAVSPVIATLMLVLVSVAAAVSFYVWESGWQKDVTENTEGGADIQSSITIGGSSTVYEFTAYATEYYETSNPGYKIAFQAGGSGAGVTSVGWGLVDIGAASRAVKSTELAAYPDLNRDGEKDFGKELVSHQVAWDAVVVVVPLANTHGLDGITEATLYDIYATNGGLSGYTSLLDTDASGKVDWDEVPRIGGGFCSGAVPVKIYDREEESGTEETFATKHLDLSTSTLEAAGISAIHKFGNQQLAPAIAGDADALGFMSYGVVSASGSGLLQIGFQGDGETTPLSFAGKGQLETYDGVRPLVYITVGEPTGAVKQYISYVLTPEYNQKICEKSDYLTIYL